MFLIIIIIMTMIIIMIIMYHKYCYTAFSCIHIGIVFRQLVHASTKASIQDVAMFVFDYFALVHVCAYVHGCRQVFVHVCTGLQVWN